MMNSCLADQDRINRERLSTRDFDRNFLVSAGAGAGKTYLTVERAFNMLCDRDAGVSPRQIVMITFTRKAATEMKTRLSEWIRNALDREKDPARAQLLERLLGSLPEMQISTIHSFCTRILSDYPLESGVGFAPKFDSEDGGPDSSATNWFDAAWKAGRCPKTMEAGIPRDIALGAFSTLNERFSVTPQFLDPDSESGSTLADRTLSATKSLIGSLKSVCDGVNPDLFQFQIANALRGDPSDGTILGAAKRIASGADKVRDWMGKTARKSAGGACEGLELLLAGGNPQAGDARIAVERMFEAAKGAKGADRRALILEMVPGLPDGYRAAAEFAETLPDGEAMKKLADDIDILLHGIIMKEALGLCGAYRAERRRNHVVTLNDMLALTAELVRNHPEVRRRLHEQYRTFFVDEYQDTDPIQTDILFAIAAERYDPDWRKCVPRPGSLFLVGDAKQGIYRFRGADISLWQEAEETMRATGGEVLYLSRNFRSTPEICGAVTDVFGEGGPLSMTAGPYQAPYSGMTAHRAGGPEAVFRHAVLCRDEEEGHHLAARQIARYIRDRVDSGQNQYGDFLLLSLKREKHICYADELRRLRIPVKFDGALPADAYPPIQLLHLRTQAVCHPLDETLSFRVLCRCGGVLPEEWELFLMNVSRLPEEALPNRFRGIRSLMGRTEELAALLPDTEMNRRILRALSMLDRDRKLSQSRTPCAFLEELAEQNDGLFLADCDAEEFQNQYAALRQVIDSIREADPPHFVDMADLLKAAAETSMDRMPSLRADSNFVRLMNLHKAKGLQGKIVIFLPGNERMPQPDNSVLREGSSVLGWFEIRSAESAISSRYAPPDWDGHRQEETEILKAERVRLKYVALTRAEDEAHIFTLRVEQEGKKPKEINAWTGFQAIGSEAPEIQAAEAPNPAMGEDAGLSRKAKADQQLLRERLPAVCRAKTARMLPSDLDLKQLESEPAKIEAQTDKSDSGPGGDGPRGARWGTLVHRAAELIVSEKLFTREGVSRAAEAAAREQFPSEFLGDAERRALALPNEAQTPEQIRKDLAGKVCHALRFMADPDSSFRKLLSGAECYPELPFVLSVTKENGELYAHLSKAAGGSAPDRIEISGKIDLALREPNGTWRVLDYKTDRMLPCDGGSQQAFRARLEREYGAQLETYRLVLKQVTGEAVTETMLISV
ncbi:MAG: UvrD-helicase domain-containing protein [Clostridia bacterium]|nr:UvrD-helicase domain-containing protein [Clostridia bacterium]